MAHDTVNPHFIRPALTLKASPPTPSRTARWRPRLGLTVLAWSLCMGPAWPQRSALPSLGEGEGISLAAERKLGDRIARELYR